MQPLVDFWRRLTNLPYAQGLKAEAAEDWMAAVEAYTRAGTPDALARVQRRLAAQSTPDEAVRLQRAAQAADPTDEGARALAEALVGLAPFLGAEVGAAHQLEAAAIFDRLNLADQAAQAYEAAGAWQDAADQYAEVGAIDAVERVIASGADLAVDALARDGLTERILGVAQAGRADEAMAALTRARAIIADQRLVDRIEAQLQALLLPPHQLSFGDRMLNSASTVTIGRAGDVQVQLRALPPIAMTLRRSGEHLEWERAGRTQIIERRTQLELAGGCMLQLRPVPAGWSAALEVRGLPGPTVWMVDRYTFPDGTEVVADQRWWRVGGRVLLRGDSVGGVTIR